MKIYKINNFNVLIIKALFFLILFQGILRYLVGSFFQIGTLFILILAILEISRCVKNPATKISNVGIRIIIFILILLFYVVLNFSVNAIVGLIYYIRPILLVIILERRFKPLQLEEKKDIFSFMKKLFLIFTIIGIAEYFIPSLHTILYKTINYRTDYFIVKRPVSLYRSIFDFGFGAFFLFLLETISNSRDRKHRIIFTSIGLIGVLSSFTRTSWVISAMAIFFFWKNIHRDSKRCLFLMLVFLFSFGIAIFGDHLVVYFKSFTNLQDPMGSINARLYYYGESVQMFKKNPFGYGVGFAGISSQITGNTQNTFFAENGLFTLIIELGIIGFFVWILVFGPLGAKKGISRNMTYIYLVAIFFGMAYLTSAIANLFIAFAIANDFSRDFMENK